MTDERFIVRPFDPSADMPRLHQLSVEVVATDQEPNNDIEEALYAERDMPGHDPVRDRTVVVAAADPEKVIGYSLTWLPPGTKNAYAHVVVRPDWRRQGLGSALLQQVLAHSRSLDAAQVNLYASYQHEGANALLRKHGFKPAGAYTEMSASSSLRHPPITWPYGYKMRTYAEAGSLAILTQAYNEAYQFLPGHHTVSQEQVAKWLPSFDLEGLFLVFSEKNRPVGISRVEMSRERSLRNCTPTGYIDAPGISSPHRRLDLYRALLLTGVDYLHAQGATRVEMESWGDTQAVLSTYLDLGFEVMRQVITYQNKFG